jgi:hypothetical protein
MILVIAGPLFSILCLIIILLLPQEVKKNKIMTVLYFIVTGYACLSIILWALGMLLTRQSYRSS